MDVLPGSRILSTILRHDTKVNSYKIALLRAINDIALSYPVDARDFASVAIPLRLIAEYWFAYYFPFCDPARPVWQGPRNSNRDGQRQDMSFRATLTRFHELWNTLNGFGSRPSDGHFLMAEFRRLHRRHAYPAEMHTLYAVTLEAISKAIQQPVRYAGPSQAEWSLFPKPRRLGEISEPVLPVPGALPDDRCVLVPPELWLAFTHLSLWIESLCIHEWALFIEQVKSDRPVSRGEAFRLLTDRPDNRIPLTWERNAINLLLLEGERFICPWSLTVLQQSARNEPPPYHVDHIVPLAVYPINDLWNLVPADPHINSTKRDRLPSAERLQIAAPHLAATYARYARSQQLRPVLLEDAARRFRGLSDQPTLFESDLTRAVSRLVTRIAYARNVATF